MGTETPDFYQTSVILGTPFESKPIITEVIRSPAFKSIEVHFSSICSGPPRFVSGCSF